MSVREEDRQKNSCSNRGLGIAAAAIGVGVGVGAAMYYFFNKRQENPNSEGSSSDWNCERQQAFPKSDCESDDSYTTISEHETTDTSINSSVDIDLSHEESVITISTSEEDSTTESASESDSESPSSDFTVVSTGMWHVTSQSPGSSDLEDHTDWDFTTSSIGIPEDIITSPTPEFMVRIESLINLWNRRTEAEQMSIMRQRELTEAEQMSIMRQREFRERSWTLEECSICFDVMLRNQDVTSLPCAHNFHTDCIMPWLQEKQTCPNCRKVAE